MHDMSTLLVPVLGRALLHFLWQGAVIGLLAAALLQALRDARPQARYAVACLALLTCALAPILGIAWQLADARAVVAAPADAAATVSFVPTLGAVTHALAQAWRLDDTLPMIVALWAAGACVLALRMALGVWWIQRLCAAPQGAASAAWQARLDALAPRFGLRRPVALRVVDALASPASVGWWRPVVLLPTALLARMPVELVEALLAHELAHIRRHDYLVNLLQGAVEAMLFYHPVTWWLSRRIRIEREQVADRLAADAIGEPRRLAVALSELSGCLASAEPLPSLALAAHGGHLMSRIEQLVRPAARRSGGRIAFPLLGLATACLAVFAYAQAADAVVETSAAAEAPAQAAAPASTPAARPVTAPVAAAARAREVRMHGDGAKGTAFAVVRRNRSGITMSGSVRDAEAIEALRRDIGGDFLWFRRAGQAWVIDDPATVDRADRAWTGSEQLGKRMEAVGAQMEVHGRKMEALGAQMEQLAVRHEDHPRMDAAARRMEELGRQQQRLAARQAALSVAMARADQAQQAQLSREMDALSARMQALGGQMEAQSKVLEAESARMQRQAQPMEALGRQMEQAGKPIEALGAQMDALGEQMDQLSARAERETLELIDAAVAKGLARPVPVRR